MIRTQQVVSTFSMFLLTFSLCASPVLAQAKKQSNRQDEKKENQRVSQAEKALREAKQDFAAAQKAFREAIASLDSATQKHKKADVEYRKQLEAVEERLEESTGIPSLLREMRETRALLDATAKPILESLRSTDAWKAANRQAEDAKKAKQELDRSSELPIESKSTGAEEIKGRQDGDSLEEELEKLNAAIEKPFRIEADAIAKHPEAGRLQRLLTEQQDRLNALRKKLGDSPAESDPAVKRLKKALETARSDLSEVAKKVTAARSKFSKEQSKVSAANRELAAARQADQKDANKPPKKKN